MRYLLFFLFLAEPAIAENWMRPAELGRGFQLKASCEAGGAKCQKVDGLNLEALKTETIFVDDLAKPVYGDRINVTDCTPEECETKAVDLCVEPYQAFVSLDQAFVYCEKIIGYEKKPEVIIVEDKAKALEIQQAEAAGKAKALALAAAQARLDNLDIQAEISSAPNSVAGLRVLLDKIMPDLIAIQKQTK